MKTIAFFNNKGGVGKTSLVYHLAWMYADLGLRVLVADLDPQANASAMFLSEERFAELLEHGEAKTIFGALTPLIEGTGDIIAASVEVLHPNLGLLPGNLALSRFEDALSENWFKCLDKANTRAFRVITAFHRILRAAGADFEADILLIDVGPNLGAINRAALLAAEYVVVPLAADLFSITGMRNLGPALVEWREGWQKRLAEAPQTLDCPEGRMQPIGYVVMQHGVRDRRPVKAYERWLGRIPKVYSEVVLGQPDGGDVALSEDPHNLSLLKHYRSLMPLAMEAHKPMFFLKSADGAIGAHVEAVRDCYLDFEKLAARIVEVLEPGHVN